MEEQYPPHTQQIANEDWERTLASVKQLVESMAQRLVKLEQLVAELQAENQLLKEKTNLSRSQRLGN